MNDAMALLCVISSLNMAGNMNSKEAASRLLKDGDLTVEVMDPNAPDRYYRGVRFTPVAAIMTAARGTNEFLYHEAQHDPLTAVAGLFAEFDLVTPPPGFAEAKLGDGFIKIGVGVLKKDTERYQFWHPYEQLQPARTQVTWSDTTATFRQLGAPCNGYGYELEATVTVCQATIRVDWRLKNSGTQPLETQHYAHNSFRFNRQPVGPDYTLEFPYDFAARKLQTGQRQEGRAIRFLATLPEPVNIEVDYPSDYAGANSLVVRHAASGLSVTCLTSLPGTRTAVHAASVYLCPEQFIALALKPGETATWSRQYRLDVGLLPKAQSQVSAD